MSKVRFWILTLIIPAAAIGSASARVPGPPPVAAEAGADVVEVEIVEFAFQADTTRVTPGTIVRWINRDQVAHTSTADDGEWESPLIGPEETFERRFDGEGDYPYYCKLHPFMRGAVVVEAEATRG